MMEYFTEIQEMIGIIRDYRFHVLVCDEIPFFWGSEIDAPLK